MSWLSRLFRKEADVAYYTWHAGSQDDVCAPCRDLDGTCWLPEADFKGPPMKDCNRPGGCTARALVVRVDEAWGPGNAGWIKKRGGVVTGKQMDKFLSS